ncbi:MAG TPA: type IV pilus assembly protein PilM [Gemmatimonadaceae bacterium]|nr:type IV pilus assembly protein PilM [Gemmatimonadaceae bacterium]
MALFGRKKTTVGLDIGSGLVKVAVVDHSKSAPELVKVAISPLPDDAIVEGEVMDPHLVSDAIRATVERVGGSMKDVVTAVGGRDVIIKRISTERVKEAQARELMRWEAEQHVPDVDSVELDFQILEDSAAPRDQMSVLLVAAKRDLVEAKLRILSEAGISPRIMDVDAFALHNAFEVNYPAAMNGAVGLINIGHEVTNINVLDDGVPILTRDLPIGTRRLREDLQREHGLSSSDAEALIRGFDRAPQLDSVIDARTEEIATGLERAVAFLASSLKGDGQMRAVYTCGGGSRTPGLTESLGKRLRKPVELANPLANMQVRDGAMDSLVTDEVAPLLMLAIGLALRTN